MENKKQQEKIDYLDVSNFKELVKLDGIPMNNRIVLQPLPFKEYKTTSGVILPQSVNEFRCGVVAIKTDSQYKRGDVVLLKMSDFPTQNIPVDYVENQAVLIVYESFIWYKYDLRIEDNFDA